MANPLYLAILPALLHSMGVHEKLPNEHEIMVRAYEAADDVDAVFSDPSIYSRIPASKLNAWKSMTYVMHGKEASFLADPDSKGRIKGSNDNGNACGALQVWWMFIPEKMTCKQVRSSRRLGLRAGVIIALNFRDTCGESLGEAWSAFAMGHCGPKKMALNIILERCKMAGISCS
jgi:hypothetical protein